MRCLEPKLDALNRDSPERFQILMLEKAVLVAQYLFLKFDQFFRDKVDQDTRILDRRQWHFQ